MKIKSISIKNYRSIERIDDLILDTFNIFVGQNNHGKTNFFEAINWFFGGFQRGEDKKKTIFNNDDTARDIEVVIKFEGLQDAINRMSNATHKTKLKEIFEDGIDIIKIRRTTEYKDGKQRQLFNLKTQQWEDPIGRDTAWRDLLPSLEYVHTKIRVDDVSQYKSKTPIAEMLSGVLTSIIEEDKQYIDLKNNFNALFSDETSEIRVRLNELSGKVEVYLKKQFPGNTSIQFKVEIPEFNDLLKNFSTEVNDGIPTPIEYKGDGMQRALMLSIIQAYADFRKEKNISRKFIFLIDEAELHLHPSAQRALKNALFDIANGGEQVFVNTHSSVLITDEQEGQKIFKVEKDDQGITQISKVNNEIDKMDIIFELLGGSPADLLLPKNFIIVEGKSEYYFLRQIIKRFYYDEYKNIKIIFARGDFERQKEAYHAIHEAYKPFIADGEGIYRNRIIIICDAPNHKNKKHFERFKRAHPWLKEGKQLHILPVDALEKYYPNPYKKTDEQIQELEAKKNGKTDLSKEVASAISQEQFENEMIAFFNALQKAKELGFEN
ncbi:ATP-dependent nuclease [Desulfonauticus submarinus]